jgi:hypothetical protein
LPTIFSEAEKQTYLMLTEIPKSKNEWLCSYYGITPGSLGQELVSPKTLDSNN